MPGMRLGCPMFFRVRTMWNFLPQKSPVRPYSVNMVRRGRRLVAAIQDPAYIQNYVTECWPRASCCGVGLEKLGINYYDKQIGNFCVFRKSPGPSEPFRCAMKLRRRGSLDFAILAV